MSQYIGAHIKKETGSLLKTMKIITKNGGNALQIFASNPRSVQVANLETYKSMAQDITQYCNQHNFRIVIHSSYTVNLAKEPKNDKRIIDLKDCYWINLLLRDLVISDIIGAIGVVVHVGKHTKDTKENGISHMFKAMAYIVGEMRNLAIKSKLILETPAGAGTELLTDVHDFLSFYNRFSDDQKKHLGICLDTAHMWSSGYDINEYYDVVSQQNLNDIIVIHYNNSKKTKNSHVDTHDTIFEGKIDIDSMQEFIMKLKKTDKNPVVILEKPSDDIEGDFKFIKSI